MEGNKKAMLLTTGNTLNDMIQGGNWRNLLEQDASDNAALVDVSREPRDTHGVQFKMHCSETIPTNNDVVLFFPNSTKNIHHGGTIIDARKYSAYPALDRSIDEALKATTLTIPTAATTTAFGMLVCTTPTTSCG